MTIRVLLVTCCVLFVAPLPAAGEYQAKGKRDPFVPLLTAEGQRLYPPGLDEEEEAEGLVKVSLQGIVFDPKAESYAIINGRIVRRHEEIDGMKVLEIKPSAVVLLIEGKPHSVTVRQATEENQTP